MIRRIEGVVERVELDRVELAVGPYVHEVLVPEIVRRSLLQRLQQEVADAETDYASTGRSGKRWCTTRHKQGTQTKRW